MKHMRKLFALVLAVMMVMSLATNAFAAETYSITINNTASGHTYEAYQIFTGDLSGNILSNIEWGSSVTNAEELADAAAVAEKMDTEYTGEDKVTVEDLLKMIELGDAAASTSTQTEGQYVIGGLEPGYYLIKDKDNSLSGNDAYTEYIIKVVKDVETVPKSDVPEVEKKVKDTNDSTGTTTDWQDSADYDIGDTVPFQLTATLPSNYSAYDFYKLVFHDSFTNFESIQITSVYLANANGEKVENFAAEDYVHAATNDGFTVTFANLKASTLKASIANGMQVVVEYTAVLSNDAVIGSTGNPNVVYLEYSNNPNADGDGNTGTTPTDKVIVFTYKVIVNKVDKDKNPLTGAGFTLYKYDADATTDDKWVKIGDELTGEALTQFVWSGLDDGNYKLVETTTPAGYNTIDPIEFTITAEHDTLSDNPTLTRLEGGDKFTGEVSTGALSADVVNKPGTTLPETGGMGTTIFYALGGILVLAAVVLLVTKRRMNIAE